VRKALWRDGGTAPAQSQFTDDPGPRGPPTERGAPVSGDGAGRGRRARSRSSSGLHRLPGIVIQGGPASARDIVVERTRPRVIPAVIGTLLLGVIVLAGVLPNTGTVQAQSSCPYGNCTTSAAVPAWEIVSILAAIAAVVIAAALVVMRRRRTPRAGPPAAAGALQPWQEGPPTGGAPAAAGIAPAAAAPYLEGPEDVGHAPPSLPATPATGAGPAAAAAPPAAAAGAEGGSDIDSLMAELDRISGEILKKSPKKGTAQKPPEETEETEPPS